MCPTSTGRGGRGREKGKRRERGKEERGKVASCLLGTDAPAVLVMFLANSYRVNNKNGHQKVVTSTFASSLSCRVSHNRLLLTIWC